MSSNLRPAPTLDWKKVDFDFNLVPGDLHLAAIRASRGSATFGDVSRLIEHYGYELVSFAFQCYGVELSGYEED